MQLLEPVVTVRCRQADLSLVQSIISSSIQQYKEATKGMNVQIKIDDTFLPANV